MRLEYTLDEQCCEDYAAFCFDWELDYKKAVRTQRIRMAAMMFLCVVIMGISATTMGADPNPDPMMPLALGIFWAIGFAISFFVAPKSIDRMRKKKIEKVMKINRRGMFFANRVLTLQDEGLRVEASMDVLRQESWYAYSAITRFERSERQYYITLLDSLFLMVPHWVFADAAGQNEFEQTIARHSGKPLQMREPHPQKEKSKS